MKHLIAFALLFVGLTACHAQQTINAVQGQSSTMTFVAKDNLGNVIPTNDYIASPTISDGTVVSFSCSGSTCKLNYLAAGTATVQWTFTLKSGTPYSGGPIVLPADTVNVSPLSIASGSVSYGPPG